MQKGSKKGVYLYLHNQAMHQLRQAAKRHQRTVATEAARILEDIFHHTSDERTPDAAGAEKCDARGLYVDLSETLLARLRPLAESNYRSLAGQAAFVLETVLSLTEDERDKKAALEPKPLLKFSTKQLPHKPAV
jgi:hypothetical protein